MYSRDYDHLMPSFLMRILTLVHVVFEDETLFLHDVSKKYPEDCHQKLAGVPLFPLLMMGVMVQ